MRRRLGVLESIRISNDFRAENMECGCGRKRVLNLVIVKDNNIFIIYELWIVRVKERDFEFRNPRGYQDLYTVNIWSARVEKRNRVLMVLKDIKSSSLTRYGVWLSKKETSNLVIVKDKQNSDWKLSWIVGVEERQFKFGDLRGW